MHNIRYMTCCSILILLPWPKFSVVQWWSSLRFSSSLRLPHPNSLSLSLSLSFRAIHPLQTLSLSLPCGVLSAENVASLLLLLCCFCCCCRRRRSIILILPCLLGQSATVLSVFVCTKKTSVSHHKTVLRTNLAPKLVAHAD